jgi:hypothetical protein
MTNGSVAGRVASLVGVMVLGLWIGMDDLAHSSDTLVAQTEGAVARPFQPGLAQSEFIRTNLQQMAGKRVTVRLLAGEELTGMVKQVTPYGVQLSELAGKEFFDAIMRLDQISAVIYRAQKD